MGSRLVWPTAFLSKVREGHGCWEFTGRLDREGYGIQWVTDVGNRRSHRLAYEYFVGPIPDGLTIDHLCRNRACCRPDHLEAVTIGVNIHRGNTAAAINAAKTHCPAGHAYDEGNTHVRKSGQRECRMCMRDRSRRQRARKRVERT